MSYIGSDFLRNAGIYADIEHDFLAPEYRIGYCNHYKHHGPLSINTYRQHKCKEKQCPYFVKNKNHPHWIKKQKQKEKSDAYREKNKEIKDNKKLLIKLASSVCPMNKDFVYTRVDFSNNCYFIYFCGYNKNNLVSKEANKKILKLARENNICAPICFKSIHTNRATKRQIIDKIIKENDYHF